MKRSFVLVVKNPENPKERKQQRSNGTAKTRIEKQEPPLLAPQVLQTITVPVVKAPARAAETAETDDEFAGNPMARGDWKLPPLSLLSKSDQVQEKIDNEVYYKLSKQLEQKLKNFGVSGKVVGISPGPVVTTYEYSPAPGVKINKIAGLADDLALGLKAQSVRVVGSVPGKIAQRYVYDDALAACAIRSCIWRVRCGTIPIMRSISMS